MQQQDTTRTGGNATAKCSEKPQRIEGDPVGFEPFFYADNSHTPCAVCELRGLTGCIAAPCNFSFRPERKTICYRKEAAK